MSKPIYVDWAITNRCNLHCRYCVGMEEAELSPAQAAKVARDIVALGPRWVILEGGEPLLRPDFAEIGGLLRRGGLDVYVITNGNAFTEEKLEMLASFSARVLFSIDGAEADTHARLKGRARLDLAVRWARSCAARGLFYGLTSVLSRLNRAQATGLIRLAEELGGREIIFLPLKPSGSDAPALAYYRAHALSPREQEEVVRELYSYPTRLSIFYDEPFLWNLAARHGVSLSRADGGITIPEVTGCAAAYSLYIQTKGDVRPCMFAPAALSCGHAATENLADIWQRMQASPMLQGWADQRARRGACGTCAEFARCRGCLARTYHLCRDTQGADPACPLAAR